VQQSVIIVAFTFRNKIGNL